MKRAELLKDPLEAAKVVDNYMGCMRCKYKDRCDNTPATEIAGHSTMCEKIWFDVFFDGTENLKNKGTIGMAMFFANIFRCTSCPVVKCEINGVGHKHGDYCICSDEVYRWLNEEIPTCQESRQDGLERRLLAKEVLERASNNTVDHPNHYQLMDGVEVIDIIDHILSRADLTPPQDFCLGNVIKYIMRADLKNGVEDYKKASAYLNRLIDSMERGTENECE